MLVVGDISCLKPNIARLVYANPDHNKQTDIGFMSEWLSQVERVMDTQAWFIICVHPDICFEVDRIVRGHTALNFHQQIVWTYEFGTYTRKKFVPSHEIILVYRRGFPNFYWQSVAIQSQRLKAGDLRGDWRGRTPGTVWSISRVPGNSIQRRHLPSRLARSCQPEELCTRIIKAYTRLSDLVVDLFVQGGTMPYVCYNIGRPCIAFGSEVYLRAVQDRFKNQARTLYERMKP